MTKSKDGITIYLDTERSGTTYIKLRASIEIDGTNVNKRVSTGLIYNDDNMSLIKEEARPLFYKKLGLQLEEVVSLNDFLVDALDYINMNVNVETGRDREGKLKRYVLPFLGKQDVKKMTAAAIEKWQMTLLKNEVSPDLVRRSKRILKRIFKRAILLGYRTDNPVDATSLIRETNKGVHEIYSRDEVIKMIAFADPWLKTYILVIAILWLRTKVR